MGQTHRISIQDEDQVGQARRAAMDLARRTGGDADFESDVAIAVTEAARNLVRHAGGGEILLNDLHHEERDGVELLALDRGPGMRSISECLRDGYSTGGTTGTGLGAIRRLAGAFEIVSHPGVGTAIWSRFWPKKTNWAQAASARRFVVGAVNVAMDGEIECGDAWSVLEEPGRLRVLLADGLGHGTFAAQAARAATALLQPRAESTLRATMEAMHEALKPTRGAAAALVELHVERKQAIACGVGNIAMRLVAPERSQHLVSSPGTVGGSSRTPQEFTYSWSPEAALVMYSDGLISQWQAEAYPGLWLRHPALIAGVLYRDFKRGRDDATVLVIRRLLP